MYLSNLCLPLIIPALALSTMNACSGPQIGQINTAVSDEQVKRWPFAANEPDVFQASAIVSSNGISERYFFARNGAARRFDTYDGDRPAITELIRDNMRYVIDHRRKVYYLDPPGDKGPRAVEREALRFFQNTQHYEFEEAARTGGRVIYRAKRFAGDPQQDVEITIDEATGMIVRQDVKGRDPAESFTFELRDVKLEAPNLLFELSPGYKQVSKDEFKLDRAKTDE